MLKKTVVLLVGMLSLGLIAACGVATPQTVTVVETVVVKEEVEKIVTVEVPAEAAMEEKGPLAVFGAYATAIEEPWDGVIHSALNKAQDEGKINYSYTDDIGYAGDMERILREVAENDRPDVIFGDAFGNEKLPLSLVRVVARPSQTFRCLTTGFTNRPTSVGCWPVG
jgi:hypothetical protein